MAVIESQRTTTSEQTRIAGTLGVVCFGGLAVVLGVHPPGDTALYDDGARYVEHMSAYWLTLHVVAGALFVLVPFVVSTYTTRARSPWAVAFGRVAASAATVGTAIGVLHLVGTDTITFAFFADTLASGAEGAETAADLLIRLHAATLSAWIVAFWFGLPAAGAAMALADGDRGWRFWVPALAATSAVVSLALTLAARQFTTLSEMGFFRVGATLLILWLLIASWQMRRDAAV